MLNLTSYIHRRELQDIMTRWLMDKFEPPDCPRLKDITNFNGHLISAVLNDFCQEMFTIIADAPVQRFEATHKASLKDFVVANPPYSTPRTQEIIAHYSRFPQDYYRGAPFHGVIYHAGTTSSPRYLGHSRIKRMRRIAEKGSRRVIDFIFQHIKNQADRLAEERASSLGIQKDMLVTDPETKLSEFVHAERRVIKAIRQGMLGSSVAETPMLRINDVAGVKVILEDDQAHRLYRFLETRAGIEVVEVERHEGNYNATNLIIRLMLDRDRYASMDLSPVTRQILVKRGMREASLDASWRELVTSGEPDIFLEIILSNYAEMIESELGRCMHEERVLAQRSRQEYRSPLANNVRYLIEYMFLFTMSPMQSIDAIPIKLWERNMPDTFDEAVKRLWDLPVLPAL